MSFLSKLHRPVVEPMKFGLTSSRYRLALLTIFACAQLDSNQQVTNQTQFPVQTMAVLDGEPHEAVIGLDPTDRCVPAVQKVCDANNNCSWQDRYIILTEDDYRANGWVGYQSNTINCTTIFNPATLVTNETWLAPHEVFADGINLPYRAGSFRPIDWFSVNNSNVRLALKTVLFTNQPTRNPDAVGHTLSDISGESYLVIDGDARALTRVNYSVVNIDERNPDPRQVARVSVHEMGHVLYDTLPANLKARFQGSVRSLLRVTGADVLDDEQLDSLPSPAGSYDAVNAFLMANSQLALSVKFFDEVVWSDSRTLLDFQRLQTNLALGLSTTCPPEVHGSPQSKFRAFFLGNRLVPVLDELDHPTARVYLQEAMVYVLHLVHLFRRTYRDSFDHVHRDPILDNDAFFNQEAFSYVLGDQLLLPDWQYAYNDILSADGLAWAYGMNTYSTTYLRHANPFLNSPEGRRDLADAFRLFWRWNRPIIANK